MIEKLTPEQEAQVDVFYQRYRDIGIDTSEADRSCTEELDKFYSLMGKESPKYIWVDSPYEANVVLSALKSKTIEKDHPKLIEHLEYLIDGDEEITPDLITKLEKVVKVEYNNFNSGNVNSYWVSYLKFGEFIGVKYDENLNTLNIWDSLIKKIGFFFPQPNVCVVCNRPKELYFDDNNEFHNEEGPAVVFRNGWGEKYFLSGVEVPKFVVMSPDTITLNHIEDEENQEVRRIMIERMGVGKYLEESGATIVDIQSGHGKETWSRALMKDKENRKFLVTSDTSTSRIYHIQVPESVNTCAEASNALSKKPEKMMVGES